MKKTAVICIILLLLMGSRAAIAYQGQHQYDGHYTAVNPPDDTGETVIKELRFEGEQVTLISGNVQQQVKYKIEGNTFTMITDFGNFSYEIAVNGEEIVLDGVVYRKEASLLPGTGSRGGFFRISGTVKNKSFKWSLQFLQMFHGHDFHLTFSGVTC